MTLWDRFWFKHRCEFIARELGHSPANSISILIFVNNRVRIVFHGWTDEVEVELDGETVYNNLGWHVKRSCQEKFIAFVKKWNIEACNSRCDRIEREDMMDKEAARRRNELCEEWK